MGSKQNDFPHAVGSPANAFQSRLLGTDDKLSFASATASVYVHSCSLRPRMTGTIVVAEATRGNRAP